ncbi:MAG: Dyp-type peroxidase [Solirubrobacteraceae bacterium]
MSPVDRRRFLKGSLATLGAGGASAAVALGTSGAAHASAQSPDLATESRQVGRRELMVRYPFDGEHQAGILTPRQPQATMISLDSIARTPTELFLGLQQLSTRIRQLTQGTSVGVEEIDDPPPDSGILGSYDAPDSLTVTLAFGATLFDHRYGLAAKQPRYLTAMRAFALDRLDPGRTGGDLLVQICAGQRDTVVHTVRELMRVMAGTFTPRWSLDAFQAARRNPDPHASTRNLFAFRDGTANPDVTDPALMRQLVWADADEPPFAAGGTYMIVRTIRQHVEFWDRVGMLEQEQMIGRYRVSGAPLGGTAEFENPDYPSDPKGERIPLNAHIRLANPRTPQTADERILRRPYNYNRGFDEAGDQDQGMLFVAFNQNPERQFERIQLRLESEPMTDYITPVGGGYFFAPCGASGPSDWVGSALARA